MHKNQTVFIVLCTFSLFLSSCSPQFHIKKGYTALRNQNYTAAIKRSLKALDKEPQNREAQKLLEKAYKKGTSDALKEISHIGKSGDSFKYDRIIFFYVQINNMNHLIKSSAHEVSFSLIDVTEKLNTSKQKASAEHYKAGKELRKKKSRTDRKRALYHFQKALSFVPNYRNAKKYARNLRESLTVYIVFPQNNDNSFLSSNDIENNRILYNKIFNALDNNLRGYSVVATPGHPPKKAIKLQCDIIVVEYYFDEIYHKKYGIGTKNELFEKEIVSSVELTDDGDTLSINKETITATVAYKRHPKKLTFNYFLRISDYYTEEKLHTATIPFEIEFVKKWGVLRQGNIDAVPQSDQAKMSKRLYSKCNHCDNSSFLKEVDSEKDALDDAFSGLAESVYSSIKRFLPDE